MNGSWKIPKWIILGHPYCSKPRCKSWTCCTQTCGSWLWNLLRTTNKRSGTRCLASADWRLCYLCCWTWLVNWLCVLVVRSFGELYFVWLSDIWCCVMLNITLFCWVHQRFWSFMPVTLVARDLDQQKHCNGIGCTMLQQMWTEEVAPQAAEQKSTDHWNWLRGWAQGGPWRRIWGPEPRPEAQWAQIHSCSPLLWW